MTQAAAPPPHLALTGANPSPPKQPQEQTPVDAPHAEVEIKPQLKPRGSVAKEEESHPVQAGGGGGQSLVRIFTFLIS